MTTTYCLSTTTGGPHLACRGRLSLHRLCPQPLQVCHSPSSLLPHLAFACTLSCLSGSVLPPAFVLGGPTSIVVIYLEEDEYALVHEWYMDSTLHRLPLPTHGFCSFIFLMTGQRP